jgi:transcriptional regulator with XRE-family HTH domain
VARKLSPEELAEIAEFVDWLFKRSGKRHWTNFASAAGVHPTNLNAWHRGRGGPNALNLIRLVKAAGVLDASAPGEKVLPPAIQAIVELGQRNIETALLKILNEGTQEAVAEINKVPGDFLPPRDPEEITRELEAVSAREEALQRELADALAHEERPRRARGRKRSA